jgi:hypothetical protein
LDAFNFSFLRGIGCDEINGELAPIFRDAQLFGSKILERGLRIPTQPAFWGLSLRKGNASGTI